MTTPTNSRVRMIQTLTHLEVSHSLATVGLIQVCIIVVSNTLYTYVIISSGSIPMEVDSVGVVGGGANAVVMEWRSCCICLEEMLDSDLLTHSACGAVLCSSCLQSSVQHSSQQGQKMPCPVRAVVMGAYTYLFAALWLKSLKFP